MRNENDDDANALSDLADGAAQVMPVNRSGGGGAVGQQMTTPANTEKNGKPNCNDSGAERYFWADGQSNPACDGRTEWSDDFRIAS